MFAGWSGDPGRPLGLAMGLGYEPGKAVGGSAYLEPKQAWLFIPTGLDRKYDRAVEKANRHLLEAREPKWSIEYSVTRPIETLAVLDGLAYGQLQEGRVILLPFGPKVFALCCLLVACVHYPEVAVWRVSPPGSLRILWTASRAGVLSGDFRATRVEPRFLYPPRGPGPLPAAAGDAAESGLASRRLLRSSGCSANVRLGVQRPAPQGLGRVTAARVVEEEAVEGRAPVLELPSMDRPSAPMRWRMQRVSWLGPVSGLLLGGTALLALGLAGPEGTSPRTFRVWLLADAHVGTDKTKGRERLATALRQSEGASGFEWDVAFDLGDL